MIHKLILTSLLGMVGQLTLAQSDLPTTRASTKNVDIRDGNHFKKGYWYIFPDRKPDFYYVEIPEKPHQVTFITDLDSISFDVKYRENYDFIVLLNGKDSCFTRISATYKNLDSYTRKRISPDPDTLSFILGDNDKIYLKGRINDSQLLDIQFDLGNGGTIIKKSSVEKVKMEFDETITLHNSDGTNQVPAASTNSLEIGNLVWDSVKIAVADNMTYREDLIVGNSLFKNKIIEIDYDQKILVIHDTLPHLNSSYSKHNIIRDGGTIPFIEGSLTFQGKTQKGWMMFDTGAYTSILNSSDVSTTNKMLGELKKMIGIDNKAFIPKLSIGSYEFSGFNYVAQKMDGNGLHLILGNDLLKRFNFILDNRNGHIYLKPNSLTPDSYRNPEYVVVRVVASLLFLLLLVGILVYWKRRKKVKY
ncbi:pepsin/retropepsin-like aspartic protease family protein [Flavivirga sp. 57AJ16]|uniref:pepsin/retropepsin-like aspartic protease family protein n=1 Tax=Flavivirga sp. 57AJ16 TaxID=3025307 RepID=UPI0023657778|nr:pepsin/retropepsin-like aspartic protease family protein [Flavivirga sp. 57AJ16]MDD7888280.1 pepsin/retropepsin-like aspartic protease family protein [Flavivirga sp. 57AJ16]